MSSSSFEEDILKFKRGDVVFSAGEASKHLYIVAKGQVQIFKENKNRLELITVVNQKDFIGELSLFEDKVRSATAIATRETELIQIKKADVRRVVELCPDWVSEIITTLTDRLRHSINVLREHRIDEDIEEASKELNNQILNQFMATVTEYRKRKGIKGL